MLLIGSPAIYLFPAAPPRGPESAGNIRELETDESIKYLSMI
jgi:hypothetical protein